MKIYRSVEGKSEIQKYYNFILSKWPLPFEEKYIDTSQGESYVRCSGDPNNTALVFLHGSGSNMAMWMEEIKTLSNEHYCISIDIIGECGKSEATRPPFREQIYANWLDEIVTKMKISAPSIVGNSLGGWIGMDYALNFPKKINKLVLIASAGLTQVRASALFWIIMTSFPGKTGFNILNKKIYGKLDIDPRALEFADLIRKHYKPRTNVLPVFKDNDLKRIDFALLYIAGVDDFFYNSKSAAQRIEKHISSSKIRLLTNFGHVLTNQATNIKKFLLNEKA